MKQSNSIYSQQHPKIRQIFEQAGNAAKVLCVALDYAKAQHVVLLCNGLGDRLKKTFAVANSPEGLQTLLAEVQSTCSHRGICTQHVFFGGEDNPPYVQNFIQGLSDQGYLVVWCNAWEAKKQRDNRQASNDELDVLAIAKTLLHKATYSNQDQPQNLQALKELSRVRAGFVALLTQQKLQIHHAVSRLFPGFLNQRQSGLAPFGRSSLALLAHHFSAPQIAEWPREDLVAFLRRQGEEHPEAASDQLQQLAAQVLAPCLPLRSCWQSSLSEHLRQYQSLQQSLTALGHALAACLAQTPGALLTSVSGVGVVLAAGILGELGDPAHWRSLGSLCSYCGIVPQTSQTGGPEKPAHTGTVQRRCNRRAKNWLVQAGSLMGHYGPAELKLQYAQLRSHGQHADFIMSKRLLRIFKDLMRHGTVYRPKELLASETSPAQLSRYYLELWKRLLDKWQGLIRWEELFAPSAPLGQWRAMVQQLYHLSLPLPASRQRKPT